MDDETPTDEMPEESEVQEVETLSNEDSDKENITFVVLIIEQ